MSTDAYAVQDIRNYVRSFIDVDINDIPDAVADAWMREGYRRIYNAAREWPWFEIGGKETSYQLTTVAGTQAYDLPTVTVQGTAAAVPVKGIRAIQGPQWELLYMDESALESAYIPLFVTSGEPTHYSVWGNAGVTLWPVPGAAYTFNLRAYRSPIDWVGLGAGGQVDGPMSWHPVLQNFVLARGWAQQTDLSQASFFQNEFESGLKELVMNQIHVPMPGPLVMNGGRVDRGLPPRLRFPFEGLGTNGQGY